MHQLSDGEAVPIFKELVPITEVVPKRDADGNVMWHYRGEHKVRPQTQRVIVDHIEREFILMPLGNGMTQKVYDFRPSEAEEQEAQRRVRRAALLDRLTNALERSPDAIDQLLSALQSAPAAGRAATKEPGEAEAETEQPRGAEADQSKAKAGTRRTQGR
ncbi:MAG TPA: hypothetical protein VNZ57_14625 [Longimicrobiales bacterium]|nr:hypothetical protein [Longimicrobiales bacterium]